LGVVFVVLGFFLAGKKLDSMQTDSVQKRMVGYYRMYDSRKRGVGPLESISLVKDGTYRLLLLNQKHDDYGFFVMGTWRMASEGVFLQPTTVDNDDAMQTEKNFKSGTIALKFRAKSDLLFKPMLLRVRAGDNEVVLLPTSLDLTKMLDPKIPPSEIYFSKVRR
jgi:hypothetical protein